MHINFNACWLNAAECNNIKELLLVSVTFGLRSFFTMVLLCAMSENRLIYWFDQLVDLTAWVWCLCSGIIECSTGLVGPVLIRVISCLYYPKIWENKRCVSDDTPTALQSDLL